MKKREPPGTCTTTRGSVNFTDIQRNNIKSKLDEELNNTARKIHWKETTLEEEKKDQVILDSIFRADDSGNFTILSQEEGAVKACSGLGKYKVYPKHGDVWHGTGYLRWVIGEDTFYLWIRRRNQKNKNRKNC